MDGFRRGARDGALIFRMNSQHRHCCNYTIVTALDESYPQAFLLIGSK